MKVMKRSYAFAGLLATLLLSAGLLAMGFSVHTAQAAETPLTTSADTSMQTQAVAKYQIWVAGKQVTSKNKGNVLGDKKKSVKYNPSTNMLTLKNARITKARVVKGTRLKSGFIPVWNYGIEDTSGKTLKIKLVGKNVIKTPSKSSPVMNYGIFAKGAVIFTGSGSLTATSNKAQAFSIGIHSSKSITLQGSVKVVSKGAPTKIVSKYVAYSKQNGGYGIAAENKITLKGSARLIANGPNGAVYKYYDTVMSFGSGYTPLVKYGASASSTKSKKSPSKSVYTKNKYVAISKAKATSKKPAKMKITSIQPVGSGLNVEFKTLSKNCTGYQLELTRVSTGQSWTFDTTDTRQDYAMLSSLAGGAKYSVRIRGFNEVGSKTYYGAWSAKKSTTTYEGTPAG